ncbi:hypothetical protein PHLCEN_2v8725 [Hermanssonia centrifuga]|uniref:Uncharacterized protein n=1 Tax=Hermanssonia centrifuga TaxID=98765 RepID=A0A2R6NSY8_9APHY|nr:hypothetical protein PHLCEN_2v8725 [Hermanssonia centrifuga]
MSKNITLWVPRRTTSADETILKYSFPHPYVPGPYERSDTNDGPLSYVPSLQSMCIHRLLEFPDQVHGLGHTRILYEPPASAEGYDILKELIPTSSREFEGDNNYLLDVVDPRLWAVLVQIFTQLPESFRTYVIPLSDIHIPLLQGIPSTPYFALITVLELSGCKELNDETIVQLRYLHGLGALDLSMTTVSSWGIKILAKTLSKNPDLDRLDGPWKLRILSLRNCMNVKDLAVGSLVNFPLLSVVGQSVPRSRFHWAKPTLARLWADLRGTQCTPSCHMRSPFQLSSNKKLYYPASLLDALAELSFLSTKTDTEPSTTSTVFPNPDPFFLRITSLHHKHPTKALRAATNISRCSTMKVSESLDERSAEQRTSPSSAESSAYTPYFNEIATQEAHRRASRSATLAFYAPPVRRASSASNATRSTRPNVQPLKMQSNPGVPSIANRSQASPEMGFMLFRPPPPWHALEQIQTKRAADIGTSDPPSSKRKRSQNEDKFVSTDQIRRNNKAKHAMDVMWGMVERRMCSDVSSNTAAKQDKTLGVSTNPFARKMATSVFAEENMQSSGSEKGKGRALEVSSGCDRKRPRWDKMDSGNGESPSDTVEKSTFPIPPPTTKPLRPISTLPIPALPRTILTQSKPRVIKKSPDKTSTRPTKQTKLSMFPERASRGLSVSQEGEASPGSTLQPGIKLGRRIRVAKPPKH